MKHSAKLRLAIVALAGAWAIAPCNGQALSKQIDVPAGRLTTALNQLAEQFGVEVAYPADQVEGLRTRGLRGEYTAEQALSELLKGTGLSSMTHDNGAILISVPQPDEQRTSAWQHIGVATPEATEQRDEAPTSRTSVRTAQGDIELEQVIVTAEKSGRSQRQSPTSMTILDARALERRPGLDSVNDIMARMANAVDSGSSNLAPAVRGVDGTGPASGRDAFFGGTRARLAYQVDGRPLSYNEVIFADTSISDVRQVEVLRGPQSLLQGRNSIGGVVAVVSNEPTYDLDAGVRVAAGNYDSRQYAGHLSGPIVQDQLAFRLTVDRKTNDSYVHMARFDRTPAGNPGDSPFVLGGDSKDWILDPERYTSTLVRGKLLFEPQGVPGWSTTLTLNEMRYSGPQVEYVRPPYEDHVESFSPTTLFRPRSSSVIVNSKYSTNDDLTFELTTSYADIAVRRLAVVANGNVTIDANEVMAEPRVRFRAFDGDLTGIAGFYFFDNDQDETTDLAGGGAFRDGTRTLAAFTELSYAITERFKTSVGGRFEREERDRTGGAGRFVSAYHATYEKFLPKLVLSYDLTPGVTVGLAGNQGYNGGGAAFTFQAPFVSYEFKPESVWNYEAFSRATVFDGRLTLNGNIFLSRYKDFQLPFDLNPDPALFSMIILNAERVVTKGVEVGARALLTRDFEAFVDLGYLETDIEKYPGQSFEGNELPRAPSFTGQVGLSYAPPRGLQFGFDVRYSGGYYSTILNNTSERVDSYVAANVQAGYRFERVRVFGYVNNVFDKLQPVLYEGATGILLQPRTFMGGVEVQF